MQFDFMPQDDAKALATMILPLQVMMNHTYYWYMDVYPWYLKGQMLDGSDKQYSLLTQY